MSIAGFAELEWTRWYLHQISENNIPLMGATIMFLGLLPAIAEFLLASSIRNPYRKARFSPSIYKLSLLLDYAIEIPFLLRYLPFGYAPTMDHFPSTLQIIKQVLILVLLDRVFTAYLPRFPEEHSSDTKLQRLSSERRLSDKPAEYNVLAVDFVAPKLALIVLVFMVAFTNALARTVGQTHLISVGMFVMTRLLITPSNSDV